MQIDAKSFQEKDGEAIRRLPAASSATLDALLRKIDLASAASGSSELAAEPSLQASEVARPKGISTKTSEPPPKARSAPVADYDQAARDFVESFRSGGELCSPQPIERPPNAAVSDRPNLTTDPSTYGPSQTPRSDVRSELQGSAERVSSSPKSPSEARRTGPAIDVPRNEPHQKPESLKAKPAPDVPSQEPIDTPETEARADAPKGPGRVGSAPPVIEADRGPLKGGYSGGGGSRKPPDEKRFHRRSDNPNFAKSFQNGVRAVRRNLAIVMVFTLVINLLVLAIPIYLFQISDRVLTSRSVDTLIMLTVVVVGAVLLQSAIDAVRRFILMRTAVEIEIQLGAPILSAAARASLHGNGREYQVLGDLQQLRSFITSGTLLAFLDAPLAPIFILAVFLIHPHLGLIVVTASLALLVIALVNQRLTAKPFADSNSFLSRATLHLDSMSRNSQIINALAMIPEAVRIWGRDTALSLRAQVQAQDRNVLLAGLSKVCRLLTQVVMLGWGAYLAIEGELTGGMVIAGSIIASRALTPIEGAIEGWHSVTQFRAAFGRIRQLLQTSPLNFERLLLPNPQGRLDVERLLFVPPPNKKVVLNGVSFSLEPGESLAIIGNSGAGKTTLGKMLVGSVLPTSGSVRLDLTDLRNWDQRQFGSSIGYLPQDVQLFPGSIKANIGRMRDDASDEAVFSAASLADVHELIASFSQGYETFVAADGAPLSGGQKQRIALARAFFGNPKLVVLDEPNSNLDAQGEAALMRALGHAKKQRITVVTITQRPALLSCVDKILVLNNGSVSMFGKRGEVLKALESAKSQGPVSQLSADGPSPEKQ